MKRMLLILAFFVFAAAGTGYAAPVSEGGVGFFEVEKVMAESPKVKALQAQLDEQAKIYSQKLEEEKAGLTADEFKKREQAYYADFLKQKKELEGQLDASLKQALGTVAKEKKLAVIFYKNSVAFGGVDVTGDVINQMR